MSNKNCVTCRWYNNHQDHPCCQECEGYSQWNLREYDVECPNCGSHDLIMNEREYGQQDFFHCYNCEVEW